MWYVVLIRCKKKKYVAFYLKNESSILKKWCKYKKFSYATILFRKNYFPPLSFFFSYLSFVRKMLASKSVNTLLLQFRL